MFSRTMPPEASVGIQRFSCALFCLFLGYLPDALHRPLHLLGRHVVQQNGLRPKFESFFQLLRAAHLHLHALALLALFQGARQHRGQSAAQRDVVVLDENAAGQIDAVIGSPAAQHGVFFQSPQAGHSLARVEHVGVGAVNGVDKLARQRGDAAQVLHQVQDHALATEQQRGRCGG